MENRINYLVASVVVAVVTCFGMTTFAKTAHSFPVEVPVNQATYHLGITGLWAKATNDDLFYASTGNLSHRGYHQVEPDYCYGFRLDAGYFFCGTGNDISANWTYFHSDDDCTTKSSGGVEPRFTDGLFTRARADADFRFNEINLEVGQKVDFCSLHTRFHFGLSYACIEHCMDVRAVGSAINGMSESTSSIPTRSIGSIGSDFWGIGPRFGLDLTYPLGNPCSNFSVVGRFAGSLLFGDIDVTDRGNVGSLKYNHKIDDICTVIPAGTFKIGLRYSSNADPGCPGYGIELGYQATGYYQVIDHSNHFDGPNNTGEVSNRISNFGLSGGYLTLSYNG